MDDPENPGHGLLVINGTSKIDVIMVYRTVNNRTLVLVPLSGINRTFDNNSFDRILVNALDGADRVIFDPFLAKLQDLGITIPARMVAEIQADAMANVGNRYVTYDESGAITS